jgi:hypothetical protein
VIATAKHIPRQRNSGDHGACLRGRIQLTEVKNGKAAKPLTRNAASCFVNSAGLAAVPSNASDEPGTPSEAAQRMFPHSALDSDNPS